MRRSVSRSGVSVLGGEAMDADPSGPGVGMNMSGPDGESPTGGEGEPRGPTVLRMMLGGQLRRYRETARVSPEQAAYEIRASRSKISRMEHGRVGFKRRDVADLLNLYGVRDEQVRARMLSFAEQASTPGWSRSPAVVMPPPAARLRSCASASRRCRTSCTSSS